MKCTDGQLRTSSFYRRIRHHPQLSDLSHLSPGSATPPHPQGCGAGYGIPPTPGTMSPATAPSSSLLTFESEPPSIQVGNNTLYPELRTPKLCGLGRVRYEILDLDRHMDSSEMTPKGESPNPKSR